MSYIAIFLLWTLILYWIHILIHNIPKLLVYHAKHHAFINANLRLGNFGKWHWSNLLLYNDNYASTVDLWVSEVIPTIIFSIVTGHWWVLIFYYIWAAFIQEAIEHNPKVNLPFILSGKRHLIHHKVANKNYGLFFPLWDKLFRTYKHETAICM